MAAAIPAAFKVFILQLQMPLVRLSGKAILKEVWKFFPNQSGISSTHSTQTEWVVFSIFAHD
ncbi:MAG: hypothetical protein ABR94_04310 [Sphingobacteriales bacterium BACL12 MAG-120802-bin5]|nr:MAG: hypothetical protein ABR94_04310 [Sphingobacteriales bacterium BACL12 MAG-120802-bin5]